MKIYTEADINQYASDNSDTIVIRTYVNDCSKDIIKKATILERKIIKSIIAGALLGYNHRESNSLQSIADTAEFIGQMLLPEHTNCYDTIYRRIYDADILK